MNLSIEKRFSCGGKESNIGLINGPAFESCSASSTYPNNQWNCEHAFSGKLIDSNYAMWATNGEGIGAWIQIFFKKEYQVTAIEYKNRDNPGERTKEIEVRFSNGETEVTKLKNSEIPSYLKITPTITKSIKFRSNEIGVTAILQDIISSKDGWLLQPKDILTEKIEDFSIDDTSIEAIDDSDCFFCLS